MSRLPAGRATRSSVKHVRRMYRLLGEECFGWEYSKDWHSLARKVATLLKEPAPAKPKRSRGHRPRVAAPERSNHKKERTATSSPKPPRRRLAKKRQRETIEVNRELQMAFDAVTRGRQIVFVTGGAGTGKSTFIRELRARFPRSSQSFLRPPGSRRSTPEGRPFTRSANSRSVPSHRKTSGRNATPHSSRGSIWW